MLSFYDHSSFEVADGQKSLEHRHRHFSERRFCLLGGINLEYKTT